jgi:CDP-paratose 2-epimerase
LFFGDGVARMHRHPFERQAVIASIGRLITDSMRFQSILITGGAGFVGSNLALLFREQLPKLEITVLDNLKRRGSDLNVPRLQHAGVRFCHGDIRCPEDLEALPAFDLLIDCSAEPSVQAGVGGSPLYVLNTNLQGTIQCLELCRRLKAAFLFLSTSRVYPIALLNGLPYSETPTRFRWTDGHDYKGFSEHGIAEDFPLDGPRSLYGVSKLACEYILQEYVYNYQLPALINRCGILTGPWQMGKVDQGVVTLWVASHYYQKPLRYTGFGGAGKQVRDLLHVNDLYDLVVRQMNAPDKWDGRVYNVGGGNEISASLLELTQLCERATGNRIPISSVAETSPVDLRLFVTDSRRVQKNFNWRPTRNLETIINDIHQWISSQSELLRPILA